MAERSTVILDLVDAIDELTTCMHVRERYVWSPDRQEYPTGRLPKPESRVHAHTDPALIAQLRAPCLFPSAGSHEPVSGTHPDSRPPMSLDAIDLLDRITHTAHTLRADMAQAAGYDQPDPAPADANLHALRGLATNPNITLDLISRTLRRIRSLTNEAKVILNYHAPVVELSVSCFCGGRLHVRSDASTDVWCAGGIIEGPAQPNQPWPIWAEPCGERWPRHLWPLLLGNTA